MSTASTYPLGTVVRVSVAFTLVSNGSAVDPTTVSVTIRRGDGIRATYTYGTDVEVVKTGTGAYRLDYTTVVPGQHWFRWLGIGTNAAADEERFIVAPAHTLE